MIGPGPAAVFGQLPFRLSLLRSARRPPVDVRRSAATYHHGRTKVPRGIGPVGTIVSSSRSELDLQYVSEVVIDHQLRVINFGTPA